MVPVPENTILLSSLQMEALANPLRSRVVLAIRSGGQCSVSELGQRLLVDPKILYYPLKKLIMVGLIHQTGTSKSSQRTEAVYDLVAKRLELPKTANIEVRQKLMRTTLKCAEQEAMAAQLASDADPTLFDAIQILRMPLWINELDKDELFQDLNNLVKKFSDRSLPTEQNAFMWTSLIVPLPKTSRAPRKTERQSKLK